MRWVVVVMALMAVLTGLCACTGSTAQQEAQPPSMASVRSVLSSYAAAVRERHRAAFLADLDPSFPRFRAEQQRDFASLSRLPFRVWRYVVVGQIRDSAAERAARAHYGRPVRLVHVTLLFALRGVEPLASRHDQYLVFTRHGGHTYLAGDDALAVENTASWVGPWRYGPLMAVRGARSMVLGPPDEAALLRRLAGDIDADVAAVTRVWGAGWSQRVVALLPASAAQFGALTGSGVREVSAAAVTDGIDSVTGRPYGQRLVLNPAQLQRLSATGLRIVLTHEITHLATAATTPDTMPRWLVEGFAEYVANLGTGQRVRVAAAELRAAVAAGRLPAALPSDQAFAAGGAALARQYEESWLACRLIAARAGQDGLVRFYRAVGTALAPRAQAVAGAFRTVLHEPQARFTTQWRAYVRAQLR